MANKGNQRAARILAAVLAAFLLWVNASAAEIPTELVPLGTAIGVRLETDGLLVIGIIKVETEAGSRSPAEEAGIRVGDLITHVGAEKVTTARQLREALEKEGETVSLRFLRAGQEQQASVCPAKGEDGSPELGVWLRSGLSGIGTMTWYDPSSGVFAALGHGVNDVDTGIRLPLKSGVVGRATVDSIQPGSAGTPGELKGQMGLERPFGSILENTEAGIFGRLDPGAMPEGLREPIPVCPVSQLRCGPAEILSDVGGAVKPYSARILRVYAGGGSRDLLIQVTDEALLSLTGGIVQGMSGSPILQDGRLVGAVTHVLISDPTRGYGISVEDMLSSAFPVKEDRAA